MTTRFADLTSAAAGALTAGGRVPVLLLPVGAVEPHGPHAPLGTDQIISAGVCERAAARMADDPRVRVLVLPALPYGVTRFGAAFPGAVGVSASTVRDSIVEVCASLAEQGFTRVVVVNNHFEPEHVAAVRAAVAELAGRGVRTGHVDPVRRRAAERLTEEFRSGSCHAGRYETSLVLAERPDLVDVAAMRELPALPVDMPAAMRAGAADFLAMGMDQAYCGAPAEATAAEGESTFDVLVDLVVEAVAQAAAQARS